jgi:hypothetical protein
LPDFRAREKGRGVTFGPRFVDRDR